MVRIAVPGSVVLCCPSNDSRFIPSVSGYVYAVKDDQIYVNLFIPTTSTFKVGKRDITITQTGNMPWEGLTEITVAPGQTFYFLCKSSYPGMGT